jgi:hypothetical protein
MTERSTRGTGVTKCLKASPPESGGYGPGELITQLAAVAVAAEVQVHGPVGSRLAAWVARDRHATAYPLFEG